MQANVELKIVQDQIPRLFRRYAIPGIVAMLFMAIQTIVDGLIVGRLISANALAAVNIISPIYTLVTAIALTLGVGCQAQIGLNLGRKDYSCAKSSLANGLVGLICFTVVSTICVNIFAEDIACFLGANEILLSDAIGYIHGVMPWLMGVGGLFFCDYTLKGLGHPKFSTGLMTGTFILNIALSLLFVVLFDWGTLGAGMGTGISFTVGTIGYIVIIWRILKKMPLVRNAKVRWSWRTFGHIAYNGSSEGLTEVAVGISTFVFNVTLMAYSGEKGVAAYTVIQYVNFICISILLGVSNGVIPILSYNEGAGNMQRVSAVSHIAILTNLAVGFIFIVILIFGANSIMEIFIDKSEQPVLDIAASGAKLMALSFLFNGFNIFAASYFTAIDRPLQSIIIAGLRSFAILIAGVTLLPFWFGLDGIWISTPVAELITVIIALFLLKNRMKLNGIK